MSAADPKFLKLTEEELNREEKERLGMDFKNMSTKILFLIAVVGTTWGIMGYLFVTDKKFSEFQRQLENKGYKKELSLHQYKASNNGFLKVLDIDVQNNKSDIEKIDSRIVILFQKGSKFEKELIKLMSRFQMKPKIEVMRSRPTSALKSKSRNKIKSRLPSELTQQTITAPTLPNTEHK